MTRSYDMPAGPDYGVPAAEWDAMSPVERHSAIVESARRVDDGWWVENTAVAKGYGQVIEQVDAGRVKVEWRDTGTTECEWRDELRAVADDPDDLEEQRETHPTSGSPG